MPNSNKEDIKEHVKLKCTSSDVLRQSKAEIVKREDILKDLFTNPEFPEHNDKVEFSDDKSDIVSNCVVLFDSPILVQFE